VIDPAGDEDRILQEANKKGLKIKYIINTHAHVDHILGNKRMQDLTNATVVIHEKEAYALLTNPADAGHVWSESLSSCGQDRKGRDV